MTRLIVTCFMAGGLVMAATPNSTAKGDTHLSGNERIALATSSPAVKIKHHKHMRTKDENNSNGYRVVENKTTINAFTPMGK